MKAEEPERKRKLTFFELECAGAEEPPAHNQQIQEKKKID